MHISYAHAVRGIFPDDLGEPAAPRLQAPDGHDGGRGVPHHAARPRGAAQERDGRLRRSRQHQVPGRVPAGLRGRGHPRHPRRVRDRSGGAVHAPALRAPKRRSARTAAFIRQWNGRLDGRLRAWAMPFSPETCSADLLRGAQAGGRRARGPGSPSTTTAGPRRGTDSVARHGLHPDRSTSNRSACSGRTCCWPTRSASTRPRSTAWPAPARRSRCARSPRPRAGAACRQHGRMPELLAKGVQVALGCDSPEQLEPPRHGARP